MYHLVCVYCGKEFTNKLRKNKTCSPECTTAYKRILTKKQMTQEARDNIAYKNGGERSSSWKGGKAPKTYQKLAFEKYGLERICSKCGSNNRISIHHIDRNKSNCRKDNLLVLCDACHKREHIAAGEMGQGCKNRIPIKKVEDKVIKELFDLGKSAPEIAKLLDYTSAGIRYRLKQMGYSFKVSYREDINDIEVMELYQSGMTARDIAITMDTTHTLIVNRLRKQGVRIKTHKESWKNQFTKSKQNTL